MAIVMLDVILTLQCMVESDVMKGVLSGLFGLQVNKPDIQLPLIFFLIPSNPLSIAQLKETVCDRLG